MCLYYVSRFYKEVLMFFLLHLCLGLMILVPSLAHAQLTSALGIPGDGASVSGVGVISGWKCQAEEITVEFLNDAGERIVINEGDTSNPVPMLYGSERPDIRDNGRCLENTHDKVGFVAIWNWGELGDGTYTAVAYDNGEEFDRNTFTVTTLGTNFLTGASKRVTVDDFPDPGDTTVLEWNEGTQHFEIVDFMGSECVEGLTLHPGEMCMGSINLAGQEIGFTFTVEADGRGCVETEIEIPLPCFDTAEEFENLLSRFEVSGVDVTRNADDSWTINSFPAEL